MGNYVNKAWTPMGGYASNLGGLSYKADNWVFRNRKHVYSPPSEFYESRPPIKNTPDRDGDVDSIIEMLRYRRPEGSKTEKNFILKFIDALADKNEMLFRVDGIGNRIFKIGDSPKVIFSSHTDSVHSHGGLQKIMTMENRSLLYTKTKSSNCLGADCAAGCWIMSEMIKARVDGIYIFHRKEESGGLGSKYLAEVLERTSEGKGVKAAIAFDRKGYESIITHQMSFRTASDSFALSLAETLKMPFLKPDDTGTFTDTENYAGIIPECSNISVGYFDQHSRQETQDTDFLINLKDAFINHFDASELIIERNPEDYKSDYHYGYGLEEDEL